MMFLEFYILSTLLLEVFQRVKMIYIIPKYIHGSLVSYQIRLEEILEIGLVRS